MLKHAIQGLVDEIVVLAEELSKELPHPDPVANLYTILMEISRGGGSRMRVIRKEIISRNLEREA